MSLILLVGPAAFAAGAFLVYVAPDLVRNRSSRWRQALAVVGAASGVLASSTPTGLDVWDAALRAAVSAGIVLLGARARPRPVLLTAALLVPAAGTGGVPLALACCAAGVALAAALTLRRQGPTLTSLAALLAGQAALRLPLDAFHGAATLVAVVAFGPLVVSGYRNLRSAHRRRVRTGVLVAAGVTVVVTGLAGVGMLLARQPLQEGLDASRSGLQAGRGARTEKSSRLFSAAAKSFAGARDGLESSWLTPARLVPVVGQNLRLLVATSRAGAELAITASESAGVAEAESITVENGRLDLARVRSLEAPLEASSRAVKRAVQELNAAQSPWIVAPLASRFDRQHADLVRADNESEVALLAVRVLPSLLGGDGPRRYFLAVQQPAELRGSGGIIGSFGEPVVEDAAAGLRRDPVYVHPDASSLLDAGDVDELRSEVREGDRPIYIAVLPLSAQDEAGGIDELPSVLGQAVGLRGTYAIVTSQGFRAASNDLGTGVAGRLATDAFNDARDGGAAGVLTAFVERVNAADGEGAGSSGGGGSSESSDGDGGGGGLLPLVLVGGAIGGGVYLMRKGNKRKQVEQAAVVGDQQDLRAELAVLADDVMRLEDDVALKPDARDDYEAGVARFRWAEAAIDAIDSPDDVPRVRRGMAEAQYAMARARAIIRGHEPPLPPAELQQQAPYGEPAIELDERRQPQYAGYQRYGGGWGGGGFFGGNGLFTGLLLGQMLGGGMGWGGGFGWGSGGQERPSDVGGGGGMFGGGGGGDWGGGGGGDFGGGGGDVGGGDW